MTMCTILCGAPVASAAQLERQMMLVAQQRTLEHEQTSGAAQMPAVHLSVHQPDASVAPPATAPPATSAQVWAAMSAEVDGVLASEGEERWAEQVMSADWISSFDEHTSLGADDDIAVDATDALTHSGIQRLMDTAA